MHTRKWQVTVTAILLCILFGQAAALLELGGWWALVGGLAIGIWRFVRQSQLSK